MHKLICKSYLLVPPKSNIQVMNKLILTKGKTSLTFLLFFFFFFS